MQYNCDFHLHHWLVDASQMLGEFESFHCNRNVNNVSWYEKLNSPPPPPHPCSPFNIGSKLSNSRKRVFDCSQKLSWGKQEILVSLPPL